MNEQQSALLESILLSSIQHAISIDNPSFISLIKIAKDNNLFFPELFQTFFTQSLHQAFFWDWNYLLENYQAFGFDLKTAGAIYSEVWLYQAPLLLKEENANPAEKLTQALNLGIILPEDFFLNSQIVKYLTEDTVKLLKRTNRNNNNRLTKKEGSTDIVKEGGPSILMPDDTNTEN